MRLKDNGEKWINYGDYDFLSFGGCLVRPHYNAEKLKKHPEYQNTYDVFSLNTEAGENGDQMFAAIYVVDVMECEDWKQDILLAIGQEDKRLLSMEKIMPMSQWAKEIVDYGGIAKPLANYSGKDSDNWEDFIISEEDLKNWLRELGVEKNIILFQTKKRCLNGVSFFLKSKLGFRSYF